MFLLICSFVDATLVIKFHPLVITQSPYTSTFSSGLNEKKLELQSQVSHNIRLIASLQSNIEANDKFKSEARRQLDVAHEKIQSLETTISCYETSLNKCEQKNFELEEKVW